MFRKCLILFLVPFALLAQLNKGGGSYTDSKGQGWAFNPWPTTPAPSGKPESVLEGAMWSVSSAINTLAAESCKQGSRLDSHDTQIDDVYDWIEQLNATLSAISANARKTGSGGGIVQVKDWPLSAVLAKGSVDTDHGITVKTVDTTGNITSSSGSVIADIITGRTGITTPGWIQANGNITAGSLTSGGGIAAGGKITGVSEPTVGTDAATKNYVDNTFAPASTNTLVVYTITGVTATGFTLSPIRLVGVTGTAATGSPSFEFAEQIVVSDVLADTEKLSKKQLVILTAKKSTEDTQKVVDFIDHGSFGN